MENKKIKSNSGSVLALAIICVALVLILIPTISFQINNQIKSNKRTYEDMKYKYLAEVGIEESIYDIEKQIIDIVNDITKPNTTELTKSKKKHTNCPKVKFDGDIPNIHDKDNGFKELIQKDTIKEIDKVYQKALHDDIKEIIGYTQAVELKMYYEIDIKRVLEFVFSNPTTYNKQLIEGNIDTFIDMINNTIKKVEDSNDLKKEEKIKKLVFIKESVIEIKCRLGMNIDIDEEVIKTSSIKIQQKNNITLNIKRTYEEDDNNEIWETKNYVENEEDADITIKLNGGKISEIDLSELNEVISREKIISTSGHKEVEAEIEFIFQNVGDNYEIVENIKYYNTN
ncbi:MAG: hypothetical protein ACRDD7_06520 [Peptostreptococcaceae bacterium]